MSVLSNIFDNPKNKITELNKRFGIETPTGHISEFAMIHTYIFRLQAKYKYRC